MPLPMRLHYSPGFRCEPGELLVPTWKCAGLAQLLERRFCKAMVGGWSPSPGTTKTTVSSQFLRIFFV